MGFIDDLKHIASDINGALDKNVNNIGVGPQGINRESYNGEVKQPVDMNNPDGLAGLGAVNASRDSVVDLASTVEAGATGPRAMFTPDMVFDSNGQLVHRNQPQQQGQQQGQSDFGYGQQVQPQGQNIGQVQQGQCQGQNDFGYGQPCYPGQNMNNRNMGQDMNNMNMGQNMSNMNMGQDMSNMNLGQDMSNPGQTGVNLNKNNQ